MTSYFFLMWIFTIAVKSALLYEKNQMFDELQLTQTSSNAPDFLHVNTTWYNIEETDNTLKNTTLDFDFLDFLDDFLKCKWTWVIPSFKQVPTRWIFFESMKLGYDQGNEVFVYLSFFSRPFTNHMTAVVWGGHFFNSSLQLPHRHLDINREIAAGSSPLRASGSRTRTGYFWFLRASR